MTKSFYRAGDDEETDEALEELRQALDELREMEQTTEWPDMEESVEEEEVEDEEVDDTPILRPTNPAAVAPFIPVSLPPKTSTSQSQPEKKKSVLPPKEESPSPEKKNKLPGFLPPKEDKLVPKEEAHESKLQLPLRSDTSDVSENKPKVHMISLILRADTC